MCVFCFFFLLSKGDTRPKERKCLRFLTLGIWTPPPPSPGGLQPQPQRPAQSERGREGTMSPEPGMCPQRLFTNTKLFMIAGKRNPTRALGSQTSRVEPGPGSHGEGGSFSDPLWARRPCAQGAAQRGRRARLGLQPRCLCLRGAEGLRPRPRSFPGDAPRSPPHVLLPPTPLSDPQSGSGKTPSAKEKEIHFGG